MDVDEFIAHLYVSTACQHAKHDYCNNMKGWQGTKRPAMCKFCSATCLCPCHEESEDER